MPKNIFALSPGRAGSMTFVHACEGIEGFTAGHESRVDRVGTARLAYPENHIEADNRLVWHLGQLAQKYDGQDVLYVHLRRDPEKIAQSYLKRWLEFEFSAGILPAFANGIVMREKPWPVEERLDVARYYVETVIANTEEFLKSRPHIDVHLEDGGVSFNNFLNRMSATGDLEAVRAAWASVKNDHNHSREIHATNRLSRRIARRLGWTTKG